MSGTDLAEVRPIAEPDPELVANLEGLLEDVKAGYVNSVLVLWGTASGGMTGRLIKVGQRDSLVALVGEAGMLWQALADELKYRRT